jgi:hypothetical protein
MTIKERILCALRIDIPEEDVIDRPAPEVSGEYLAKLQQNIDSKLEDGLTFKTVRRASW